MMTVLEWTIVVGTAVAILSFFFTVALFIRFTLKTIKLKKMPRSKIKNPKKRKKVAYVRHRLMRMRKQSLQFACLFLVFTVLFSGGVSYASYYQSVTLVPEDRQTLARSYFTTKEFYEELAIAAKGEGSKDEIYSDLQRLATELATSGTSRASRSYAEEGQTVLNRYYNALKELGKNAVTNLPNFYGNEELVLEYQEDLQKVENYQKQVFDYYKVNEASMKKG